MVCIKWVLMVVFLDARDNLVAKTSNYNPYAAAGTGIWITGISHILN